MLPTSTTTSFGHNALLPHLGDAVLHLLLELFGKLLSINNGRHNVPPYLINCPFIFQESLILFLLFFALFNAVGLQFWSILFRSSLQRLLCCLLCAVLCRGFLA